MDLNTASIPAMAKVVGIESAYDLFLWRPFLSWGEVERVPGFTAEKIKLLRQAGAQVKLPGEPLTRREALDARLSSIDQQVKGERGALPSWSSTSIDAFRGAR